MQRASLSAASEMRPQVVGNGMGVLVPYHKSCCSFVCWLPVLASNESKAGSTKVSDTNP